LGDDAIAIEEASFRGGGWDGRSGKESGEVIILVEEILDELAKLRIGAGLVEEGLALFEREVEDLAEKLFRGLLELIHLCDVIWRVT